MESLSKETTKQKALETGWDGMVFTINNYNKKEVLKNKNKNYFHLSAALLGLCLWLSFGFRGAACADFGLCKMLFPLRLPSLLLPLPALKGLGPLPSAMDRVSSLPE